MQREQVLEQRAARPRHSDDDDRRLEGDRFDLGMALEEPALEQSGLDRARERAGGVLGTAARQPRLRRDRVGQAAQGRNGLRVERVRGDGSRDARASPRKQARGVESVRGRSTCGPPSHVSTKLRRPARRFDPAVLAMCRARHRAGIVGPQAPASTGVGEKAHRSRAVGEGRSGENAVDEREGDRTEAPRAVRGVIARVWRLTGRADDADTIFAWLESDVVPALVAAPGNCGVLLLSRDDAGDRAQVLAASLWRTSSTPVAFGAVAAVPACAAAEDLGGYDVVIRGDLAFGASLVDS
jgi:hypothetical protein